MGLALAAVQVAGAEAKDLAQGPGLDQLLGTQGGREEAVLESHLRDASVIGQSRLDGLGLVCGGHQRLVAVDVLLVTHGRQEGF